ncbi:ABC transporter, solute-binding protein [Bordetella bronchiseptica F2]|nr:ABC transporter, solute-binding protein [Bordetella bronchiseptica F2]KDD49687.1 ABC transporter, solute-binding protein [Bordetella bronchiseptica MBORD901]KDD91507.1 ABC transporter, solute-binding protein [Bordetella bronchiseptica MO275]
MAGSADILPPRARSSIIGERIPTANKGKKTMPLALFRIFVFLMVLPAFARVALAAEVVLYSSNNVETVNGVIDGFAKAHPDIKVSVVRAGTGALMQRIKAEAANPLGDIFWSGGLSTISEFRDMFAPYQSPEAAAVAPAFREASGLWLGTNTHVTVLMANLRQAPGGKAPQAWADLADPAWKGKIVIPDPERSSSSFVALYGLRELLGKEMLAKVARNAVIVGTTSAAYEGVAKGEFAVAVTMEYAGYEYVAGGLKEIRLVYPREGTFLSPEGMALIKGGKNPEAARKLYEYLASAPTQTEVFKSAYRRPLRGDIDVSKYADIPAMADIKIVELDSARMGSDRAAFIAEWRQLANAR